MTDSASTSVSGKNVPHQERVRDVDAEATLGLDPWRPLHEACDRLHIHKPKNDLEMQQVSRLWNGRRDVELRLLGYATQDFEFLRSFPGLERPVAGCVQLESLHLQRQTKDFDELRSLRRLRYLGLSGISLPNLSVLLPFENLRSLYLGFCKPLNLDLLERLPELEALHFIKINNLHDLSALRLARNLRRIELEWLPHVETLPDLSELARLEEVEIGTMKSLRDVSSIAKAPALRFLGLWDCKALTPQSFECLIAHPTLRRVNFGVGRLKDNNAIAAMFLEQVTQVVYYKITPGTYLRRPTP